MAIGSCAVAEGLPRRLHYAANAKGDFAGAASVGFNLVDVSSPAALRALPPGLWGVYWLGNGYNTTCSWRLSDQQVEAAVKQVKHHPRFSGIYYIADEPHPATCPDAPRKVGERSALIRSIDPKGKTFIIVLNASKDQTEFEKMASAADLIGVDPYPCNRANEVRGCNLAALTQRIDQALAAGIAASRIVPVFQTFGQTCTEAGGQSYYRLPTVAESEAMLKIWDEKVPPALRPFDMAYSWLTQGRLACPTLAMADGRGHPDLRSTFAAYFARLKAESSKPH